MDKKFKHGDRVYHKNLKQYGFFIGYAWESEEECDVDFETEDVPIKTIMLICLFQRKIKFTFHNVPIKTIAVYRCGNAPL